MRIFVTGGSGFIGGHIIERLAARHEVLALARSEQAAATVQGFGARPLRGDLAQLPTGALEGVEVVVHAAAWVKSFGRRADFVEGNVEGTRRMLEAAKAAGVQRFVHLSSEAVLFTGQDLIDVDETAPLPRRHRYLYSETKALAEQLVQSANAQDFTTLCLRPRMVWGPRDAAVLPEVLDAVQRGAFAWLDRGQHQTSTTFVGNVAAAVELALTRGRGGQAYFIADAERHLLRDFFTSLAATRDVTLPDASMPGWLARPLASLVDATFATFAPGRRPPLSAFALHMLASTITVKTDKARSELGYQPEVSFAEGLARLRGAVSASGPAPAASAAPR